MSKEPHPCPFVLVGIESLDSTVLPIVSCVDSGVIPLESLRLGEMNNVDVSISDAQDQKGVSLGVSVKPSILAWGAPDIDSFV